MSVTEPAPLAPFVDAVPMPRRLVAAEHHGQLTVRIRAGRHRFHRDLPPSIIWGFDGSVPGPTIDTERGQPVDQDDVASRPRRFDCRGYSRNPCAHYTNVRPALAKRRSVCLMRRGSRDR